MNLREKEYQRLLAYGIDQLVSIVFPDPRHRAHDIKGHQELGRTIGLGFNVPCILQPGLHRLLRYISKGVPFFDKRRRIR